MKFYVQYREDGYISGEVSAETPPEHPRQLEFDAPVNTTAKKVVNGELVDAPELVGGEG